MIPDPGPTPEQQAVELEAAADIADAHGNFLFARELRDRAGTMRSAAVPARAGIPTPPCDHGGAK